MSNNKYKILVIEDDRNILSMIQTVLDSNGYQVLTAQRCQQGKVMTYSAIISAIWGAMDEGSVKKLQVNMANIRKKLGSRPGDTRYITNELGVGYRMLDSQD